MTGIAEAGIVHATKTGSYNHNEIVVTGDLDVADEGFAAGSMNHNEIVVESSVRASEPAPESVQAAVTRRAGAIGGNHNEIVLHHAPHDEAGE
ncbi:hypothetical protein [Streptomyces aureus]|uniref:hypothetical protein n=1 Tax=Streptomyces aureus TaxID=193461 RepID=UPI00056B28D2|nr:hypothetical protein [Streptomyces aureus]